MINIIFLLLLYFMVAGNLDPDFDITLPVAARNAETNLREPAVYVTSDSAVWFESRKVNPDELQAILAAKPGIDKLRLHADANIDALIISNIMDAAAQAGVFRFTLVTRSGSG